MNLPSVKDLQVAGKRMLLRTDYDVIIKDGTVVDDSRIKKSLPTIKYLLEQKAKIIIISHLGRPGGKVLLELSLKPVARKLEEIIKIKVSLVDQVDQVNQEIILLENLRFGPGEESNDLNFSKNLASLANFYVNEAFAVSHRNHASIVGIPKYLPSAFGFSFIKEVETLSKVRDNPARPVTLILGGAKEDKLDVIIKLAEWTDNILIGGKLPEFVTSSGKILVAKLNSEGKDIVSESIAEFKKIIVQSRTIVWVGPMGIYEEEKNALGTAEVAQAIVNSGAFSVVGGGDTQAALTKLGFSGKMSYVSSGGGAMLEFLANGTLPGIEAIKHGKSSN